MLSSKKIPIEFQTSPTKFKKPHKIKLEKAIKFYPKLHGSCIVAQSIQFMPVKQLLATLKIVKPVLKKISRKARLRLRTWPTFILTRKAKDIRMGRGKGVPTDRVAVSGNSPIFSIHKSTDYALNKLMRRCAKKVHKAKHLLTYKW